VYLFLALWVDLDYQPSTENMELSIQLVGYIPDTPVEIKVIKKCPSVHVCCFCPPQVANIGGQRGIGFRCKFFW